MTKSSKKSPARLTDDRRNARPKERGSGKEGVGAEDVVTGRDGEAMTPRVRTGPQCSAHRTNGLPCKNAPIKGSVVCSRHGGAAPQVKKKARERLMELVDPALAALDKVLHDEKTDDAVKVRAATAILDRTGFRPGMVVQVSAQDPWGELMAEVAGDVGLDRTLEGGTEQEAIEARARNEQAIGQVFREDAWNQLDNEDLNADESTRARYDPETVVQGEVTEPNALKRRLQDQGSFATFVDGPLSKVESEEDRRTEQDEAPPTQRYGVRVDPWEAFENRIREGATPEDKYQQQQQERRGRA